MSRQWEENRYYCISLLLLLLLHCLLWANKLQYKNTITVFPEVQAETSVYHFRTTSVRRAILKRFLQFRCIQFSINAVKFLLSVQKKIKKGKCIKMFIVNNGKLPMLLTHTQHYMKLELIRLALYGFSILCLLNSNNCKNPSFPHNAERIRAG